MLALARIARRTATAALLLLPAASLRAETMAVVHATLAEKDQKTSEVSTEQVRRVLTDGGALLVDTRTRAEFAAGHIPGARNLDSAPDDQVAAVGRLVAGDKTAPLILYCNGPFCQASRRLADRLVAAGHTNVRRYQLGIPIWRALGGPTAVERDGVARIIAADRTAVFVDARSTEEYAKDTLPGAVNVAVEEVVAGRLKTLPLPEDDFNRRIVLFGRDSDQARRLAEVLSKRPWHNVAYFAGSYEDLRGVKPTQ